MKRVKSKDSVEFEVKIGDANIPPNKWGRPSGARVNRTAVWIKILDCHAQSWKMPEMADILGLVPTGWMRSRERSSATTELFIQTHEVFDIIKDLCERLRN